MRQQLQLMQRVAANLLTYLEKHPQSIPAARRFIDTYQDRAAAMAEEYRELEKTGLDTEQVNETREHIKETLASFDEAYEKEFERVLGEKLLDMDAELSVLQKTMEPMASITQVSVTVSWKKKRTGILSKESLMTSSR